MVTEAVAELKGEPVARAGRDQARPARSTPTCRRTTSAKEELRLEAYRRLAAVTTEAEVDDIRAEWEDRYGPVPAPGRGAARRRPPAGRVRPAPASARSPSPRAPGFGGPALHRPRQPRSRCRPARTSASSGSYKGTVYKDDIGQLQLPIKAAADAAAT